MIEQARLNNQAIHAQKLERLRLRIHEEDYLHAAIQRLALVLSNELMEITRTTRVQKAGHYGRQRKGQK